MSWYEKDDGSGQKLTEEDIRYLLDALHAYKRSEIDYLLFIQDILTEEKYYEYRRKIEDRHQEVLEKLLSILSEL